MAILTATEQQAIKPFDYNWINEIPSGDETGVSNFDILQDETETVELMSLLGVALLQDLQDNPTTAANVTLLSGGTFTDCNNLTVKFKGVKYINAYLNFSNYTKSGYAISTDTGMVKKSRGESESLNKGERKEIENYTNSIAMTEFEKIKQFLNENSTDYPLWICTESKRPFMPQFEGIRKTVLR